VNVLELVSRSESMLEQMKHKQNLDKESVWYGSYYDNETIVEHILPLYIYEESKYYKDVDLLNRMHLNMDFFLRMQFSNGLLSLWNCNIISPPDTGFVIISLAVSLDLIEKIDMPELDSLKEKIIKFLKGTIPGMVSGGFHTPNHRWVISCALAFLYKRFGGENLKDRILEFVAEGIDINSSGEWTERSNGAYNGIVDLCSYHIAEIIGINDFYEAAKKNLYMMTYMLHPGDDVVTEYSARQDRGKKTIFAGGYYGCAYLMMAAKDNNGIFTAMAEKCIGNTQNPFKILIYLKLYEDTLKALPAPKRISENYIKLFNEGNVSKIRQPWSLFGDTVLRYRKDNLSITIMSGQKEFLYIQYGQARAACIKMPVGWFGMGGISFIKLEQTDEFTFKLTAPLYGDYVQVLSHEKVKKFEGNFLEMPNDEREKVNKVETHAEIIIKIKEDGVDLNITMNDLPYIFTQLVVGFDSEGEICGTNLEIMPNGAVKPVGGNVTYRMNNDYIEVCGEADGHDYELIRGDVFNGNMKNIIFNSLSPKDWHIRIRCGELYERLFDRKDDKFD